MKAQIAEIQLIQQQTLQSLGNFVTALNEKIESIDNFHMLIEEIRLGRYNDESKLYSLCCILSQLDKRTLEDDRKLDIMRGELVKRGIVSEDGISVSAYLDEILTKNLGLYWKIVAFDNDITLGAAISGLID
jgi:hypothetical protein